MSEIDGNEPAAPSIMIVDDLPDNLRLMCDILAASRYRLRPVSSGRQAMQAVLATPPDLVILDVMMPEMDGFELCGLLKANPETRHIPVIMVTALTDKESRIRGLRSGADDFICKPVDAAELGVRVQNLLKVKEYWDFRRCHEKLLERQVRERTADLERVVAELKATRGQMLHQEKMALMGQLMAGIAHEINNPVGFISGNLASLGRYCERLTEFIAAGDRLAETAEPGPGAVDELRRLRRGLKIDHILADLPELIRESLEGTERVKSIVLDMKCFSRHDKEEWESADVNRCLESALNIVHNELKYKASVTRDLGDLPPVRCLPRQLGQVFTNLLVNAAQAMDTRGEIVVTSRHLDGRVSVSVRDTGRGIPEEIRERIFEPFFTTKEAGAGTGLGLSISYDIVRKHGGDITVASASGLGTTFTVSLPVDGKGDDKQ